MNDMTLEIDPRNAGVLREWDGEHGAYWAEHAATYNASIARYQPALLAAIGAEPGERILDVGCGSGELAIDVVRGAPGATALGSRPVDGPARGGAASGWRAAGDVRAGRRPGAGLRSASPST